MSVTSLQTNSPSLANAHSAVRERPVPGRTETDQILSYYQSDLAGRTSVLVGQAAVPTASVHRETSTSSSSSSSYSLSDLASSSAVDERDSSHSTAPGSYLGHPQRRRSKGSTGAAEKRRIRIVELDAEQDGVRADNGGLEDKLVQAEIAAPLLSRRGFDSARLGALAVVVPPGVSRAAFSDSEPPQSAPAAGQIKGAAVPITHSVPIRHNRSASEAISVSTYSREALHRKRSRDVGIVGMSSPIFANGIYNINAARDPSPTKPGFSTTHSRSDSQPTTLPSVDANEYTSRVPSTTRSSVASVDRSNGSRSDQSTPYTSNRRGQLSDSPSKRPTALPADTTSMQSFSAIAYTNQHDPLKQSSASSKNVASYLAYQPGVHSSAGPLPTPPRQILPPSGNAMPPPRPPRLHSPPSLTRLPISPKKSGFSIPDHSSQRSESWRAAQTDDESARSITTSRVVKEREASSRSSHTREAAFAAQTDSSTASLATSSKGDANAPFGTQGHLDNPNVNGSPVVQLRVINAESPQSSRTDTSPDHRSMPTNATNDQLSSKTLEVESRRSHSPLSDRVSLDAPSLTERSYQSHSRPTSYTTASLPPREHSASPQKHFNGESASRSSLYVSSQLSLDSFAQGSSRPRQPSPVRKIRSMWPEAMKFKDVTLKKSSLERSMGYANKINELAEYDCGLRDWVAITHQKAFGRREPTMMAMPTSPTKAGYTFVRQPRNISGGSDATFPRRADAYVATDLMARSSEDGHMFNVPPPVVPYPSLVQSPRSGLATLGAGVSLSASPSTRSVPSTLSSGKSIRGGGFFASIGRKTSIRREKSTSSASIPPSSAAPSRSPTVCSPSRSMTISAPSLPGGPRAPPNRVQRTQSIIVPSTISTDMISSPMTREDSHHRLSMRKPNHRSVENPTMASVPENIPDFDKQVRKLQDLLPQADKTVLAGYLRRTGQDILAIGQYLEDEKNGTVRYD